MKRVLVLNKSNPGGVAWFRVNAPWSAVQKQFRDEIVVDFTSIQNGDKGPSWPDFVQYDWFVVHSPTHPKILKMIEEALYFGCRLWIDFDDLVMSVPTSNAASRFFDDNSTRVSMSAVAMALQNNGVVSVSTSALKDEIESRLKMRTKKSVRVIQNAHDDCFVDIPPSARPANIVPHVVWRGSGTHDGDLLPVRNAFRDFQIKKVGDKMTGIRYIFFGHLPYMFEKIRGGHLEIKNVKSLKNGMKPEDNAIYIPWNQNFMSYQIQLRGTSPDYIVVPLVDDAFNRCKSNIAWIEATNAGAVTIAPSYLPEFADLPCIHYKTEAELAKILRSIAGGKDMKGDMLERSRELLNEKYRLSDMARRRFELL